MQILWCDIFHWGREFPKFVRVFVGGERMAKERNCDGAENNSEIKYFNFKPRHAPHSVIIRNRKFQQTKAKLQSFPLCCFQKLMDMENKRVMAFGRLAMVLNSLDSSSVLIKMTKIISFKNIWGRSSVFVLFLSSIHGMMFAQHKTSSPVSQRTDWLTSLPGKCPSRLR